MNRPIKFRIWDKENNAMEYPSKYVLDFDWFGVTTEHYLDDSNTSEYPINEDEFVVMQFTGLLDRNGVEIYEGDIVTFWDDVTIPQTPTQCTTDVFWWNELSQFSLRNTYYLLDFTTTDEIEIIGNLFENPELLSPQSV